MNRVRPHPLGPVLTPVQPPILFLGDWDYLISSGSSYHIGVASTVTRRPGLDELVSQLQDALYLFGPIPKEKIPEKRYQEGDHNTKITAPSIGGTGPFQRNFLKRWELYRCAPQCYQLVQGPASGGHSKNGHPGQDD